MSQILLGVSASVSIYKACDLASKLSQAGHQVRTVLTENAARLVSPQLFAAVTGESAQTSEWGIHAKTAMDHIELARWAELVVVAPATASLCARLAAGLAEDLVCTTLLAVESSKPHLLCPAMNPVMLAKPAVARNLAQLAEDGWEVLFDGTSTDAFRGFKSEEFPKHGWEIEEDGTLHRMNRSRDIMTRTQYSDFDLRLEWKSYKGANSGIIYRIAQKGNHPSGAMIKWNIGG